VERDCDKIYGGAKNCKKINERKMLYRNIYKYFDPKSTDLMKKSVKQWSALCNNIWGMNKIMSIKNFDTLLNYDIVMPNIDDDLKRHYLLFLYQLDVLKVVSDKECKMLNKLLKLPKNINNCNTMKKYFKEDIENLKKFLRK